MMELSSNSGEVLDSANNEDMITLLPEASGFSDSENAMPDDKADINMEVSTVNYNDGAKETSSAESNNRRTSTSRRNLSAVNTSLASSNSNVVTTAPSAVDSNGQNLISLLQKTSETRRTTAATAATQQSLPSASVTSVLQIDISTESPRQQPPTTENENVVKSLSSRAANSLLSAEISTDSAMDFDYDGAGIDITTTPGAAFENNSSISDGEFGENVANSTAKNDELTSANVDNNRVETGGTEGFTDDSSRYYFTETYARDLGNTTTSSVTMNEDTDFVNNDETTAEESINNTTPHIPGSVIINNDNALITGTDETAATEGWTESTSLSFQNGPSMTDDPLPQITPKNMSGLSATNNLSTDSVIAADLTTMQTVSASSDSVTTKQTNFTSQSSGAKYDDDVTTEGAKLSSESTVGDDDYNVTTAYSSELYNLTVNNETTFEPSGSSAETNSSVVDTGTTAADDIPVTLGGAEANGSPSFSDTQTSGTITAQSPTKTHDTTASLDLEGLNTTAKTPRPIRKTTQLKKTRKQKPTTSAYFTNNNNITTISAPTFHIASSESVNERVTHAQGNLVETSTAFVEHPHPTNVTTIITTPDTLITWLFGGVHTWLLLTYVFVAIMALSIIVLCVFAVHILRSPRGRSGSSAKRGDLWAGGGGALGGVARSDYVSAMNEYTYVDMSTYRPPRAPATDTQDTVFTDSDITDEKALLELLHNSNLRKSTSLDDDSKDAKWCNIMKLSNSKEQLPTTQGSRLSTLIDVNNTEYAQATSTFKGRPNQSNNGSGSSRRKRPVSLHSQHPMYSSVHSLNEQVGKSDPSTHEYAIPVITPKASASSSMNSLDNDDNPLVGFLNAHTPTGAPTRGVTRDKSFLEMDDVFHEPIRGQYVSPVHTFKKPPKPASGECLEPEEEDGDYRRPGAVVYNRYTDYV